MERRTNSELRSIVNNQREEMDGLSKQVQETEQARIKDQEENWKKQAELEKNKLCCCSFIFCWIVTFWSKFNQTLLLRVHILDEIELLLFPVHCVKSWNLLVLTVMEKL